MPDTPQQPPPRGSSSSGLTCGSLILIALIVSFCSGRQETQKLRQDLRRLQSDTNTLQYSVDSLHRKLDALAPKEPGRSSGR